MSIGSIFSTGIQNMQAAINRTAIAGSQLNVEQQDFAAKMVAMRQGEIEVKAGANVIKTADEMLGTIINVRG